MGTMLFVRNLGTMTNASALEDLFTTVGDVASASVQIDKSTGVDRLVGYVNMTSEQSARDCIDRFNGFQKDGLRLIVTEDVPHVPLPPVSKSKKNKATNKSKAKSAAKSAARSVAKSVRAL